MAMHRIVRIALATALLQQCAAWMQPARPSTAAGTCRRGLRRLRASEETESTSFLEPLDADAEAEAVFVDSSGREIDALMDAYAHVGGKRYIVALPRDEPALIATPLDPSVVEDSDDLDDDDMEVVEVESDAAAALIGPASAALAEVLEPIVEGAPVEMVHSAFVFTVKNAEFDAIEEPEDDDELDDDEEEEYEVEMITSFEVDGKDHYIYRILEPVIMAAYDKPNADGKFELVTDEEHDDIIADIWGMLADSAELEFED